MTDDEFDYVTDALQQYIEEEHGFLSWLNTRVESVEKGSMTLKVPYDEKLLNKHPSGLAETDTDTGTERIPPTIHGGVAATLIDTVGGLAQRTMFEDPMRGGVATVNLNVNYLRRASGDMIGTAEVVRTGNSIGWSDVTVVSPTPDGDSQEVATGQVAYRLFR